MKKDGVGGGNTKTGLDFEVKTNILTLIEGLDGYSVKSAAGRAGHDIYFNGQLVARCFKQHGFYKYLHEHGIDWRSFLSKKLLPDGALLVIVRETLFIIEVKYQQCGGSVDEKLQTCDFKRKQYAKLVCPLGLKVEFVYVLNDWFNVPGYKDTLDYISSMNCHYKFNVLPMAWLGLPVMQK